MSEELAKELSITEEQTEKIREACRKCASPCGTRAPAGLPKWREKMNAKVMEILTDEQKAKYKEMLGEPFDVAQLRDGRPGRWRRRGGN